MDKIKLVDKNELKELKIEAGIIQKSQIVGWKRK